VEDFNNMERQTVANTRMTLSDEIEHYRKNIEIMKTSINEHQSQCDKLNHQINNLSTNFNMYETKRKGMWDLIFSIAE
jgi:chromosome segregation ATPase